MWWWNFSVFMLYFINFSDGYNMTENFENIALSGHFIEFVKNYKTKIKNDISVECSFQLDQYCEALLAPKLWAWQMFDAGTKIPSGMLSGNLVDLGGFDQCLNIEAKLSEGGTISGKYCLGAIPLVSAEEVKSLNSNFSVFETPETRMADPSGAVSAMFATCLPDACSATDIQRLYSGIGSGIEFSDTFCSSKSSKPDLTGGDIATISFLSVILCVLLVSTIYDGFLFYMNKKPLHSLLIAFSVLANGKKLLATTKGSSQISCLHGIRVISMMWVMLGHRYTVDNFVPKRNYIDVIRWMRNEKNMFIMGATVSVDTFFLLGGLLVAYAFMCAMAKGFKFNIIVYYIHRYLRLTPVLAVIILIYATILKHLGSGPLWIYSISQLKGCEEYWWSTLLYVQNYVNPERVCIGQTWYLAVDTQLFLLSPIILIPLKKWPIVGLVITAVCLFGSILASFLVAWFDELNGFILLNQGEQMQNFSKHFYFATHTRAGPWLMGIMLGYYIYDIKQKHKKISINKLAALVLWAISLIILCACVYTGHIDILSTTHEYDRVANSFYIALLRPGWALGICWVIFACVIGYGGPVNWFLSLPMFQVISKFTYSMYLLHALIQFVVSGQIRTSAVFSNLQTLYTFWGDFAFTLAISVIFTLAFESPIIIIEKVIFGVGKKKDTPPNPPLEDEKNHEIP